MSDLNFDILIIGAGPSGCMCALQLAESGLSVVLTDKAKFPREKVCGDGIGNDVLKQFARLNSGIAERFMKLGKGVKSHGFLVSSYNSMILELDLAKKNDDHPAGFVMERRDFDEFMLKEVKNTGNITILENTLIERLEKKDDEVIAYSGDIAIHAKMLVGADGAYSLTARTFLDRKPDLRNYYACVRTYFDNVQGLSSRNFIEFHFVKDILPGYFWIFPLGGKRANVGFGVIASDAKKRNLKLKEIFRDIIDKHPYLSERFQDSIQTDSLKSYGLPAASLTNSMSGDRFILTGDAAVLADPFTGEGIGNAIRSGRFAAEHLIEVFNVQNFSPEMNKKYELRLKNALQNEVKRGKLVLRLLRHPKLVDFIASRAKGNQSLKKLLTSDKTDKDILKVVRRPSFYFTLLFGRRK